MMTTFKQAAKIVKEADIGDRTIVSHKHQVIRIRHMFYYRHGYTAAKWKATVEKCLARFPFTFVVESCEEHWNSWPKESYWEAVVKVVDPADCVVAETIKAENHVHDMMPIWTSVDRMHVKIWHENSDDVFALVQDLSQEACDEIGIAASYKLYREGDVEKGNDYAMAMVYKLDKEDKEFTAKEYFPGTVDDSGISRQAEEAIHAAAKILANVV